MGLLLVPSADLAQDGTSLSACSQAQGRLRVPGLCLHVAEVPALPPRSHMVLRSVS